MFFVAIFSWKCRAFIRASLRITIRATRTFWCWDAATRRPCAQRYKLMASIPRVSICFSVFLWFFVPFRGIVKRKIENKKQQTERLGYCACGAMKIGLLKYVIDSRLKGCGYKSLYTGFNSVVLFVSATTKLRQGFDVAQPINGFRARALFYRLPTFLWCAIVDASG